MYNMGTPHSNNISSNPFLNSQTPKGPMYSQPNMMNNNTTNVKRTLKPDNESLGFVKKKVKTEDESKEGEINQYYTDPGKTPQDFNYSQTTVINTPGNVDRNVFGGSILNNILVPNNTQQPGFHNSAIVIPILQTPQGPIQQPITIMPAQNNAMNPVQMNQLIQQNMKPKPMPQPNTVTVINPPTPTPNDSKKNTEGSPVSEAFMKEFQNRILGLLFTQNKMLIDLKEKNEILQDTLACLINEINSLKGAIKHTTQDRPPVFAAPTLAPHQVLGNSTETVTVEHLITYLYGPNADFQYQLVLKSDMPLPLYRERNFKFTVILTDKKGNPVENSNRIPLTIGIYSSENPPKYIDSNTAGNKILKGFIEKDLVNGSATFEKIQIKEVTSHFRNGWVFFVVYPKLNSGTSNTVSGNGLAINAQKVKPLILEKVVVKAKKAKEKDTKEVDTQEENVTVVEEKEEEQQQSVVNKEENEEIVYS